MLRRQIILLAAHNFQIRIAIDECKQVGGSFRSAQFEW